MERFRKSPAGFRSMRRTRTSRRCFSAQRKAEDDSEYCPGAVLSAVPFNQEQVGNAAEAAEKAQVFGLSDFGSALRLLLFLPLPFRLGKISAGFRECRDNTAGFGFV